MPATAESVSCKSGFVQSGDDLNTPREIDQEQDDNQGQNSNALITSNCHSSLQLLTTDAYELQRSESQILLSNSVLLLSSQLFVHQTADPPRIG